MGFKSSNGLVKSLLVFIILHLIPLVVICEQCERTMPNSMQVDFDSISVYPNLDFQATWTLEGRHFWKSKDFDFEGRYLSSHAPTLNHGFSRVRSQQNTSRPLVKVFVLPFSHNDPGWKMTYEGYFYSFTKKILDNAVEKMTVYKNMTFAWSEISFLSKWWDEANSTQKELLRKHVHDGRFEILTGGWVMPDEATPSLFALVNQLIEGHQWLHLHLKITPKSAWSLDSFGHGSTMPYILKKSGIQGMMIQRVHYGWKHWFAQHRKSDFIWVPRWSEGFKQDGIICHNAHYDIYPTKHSCGPHQNTCMKFDFRKVEGKREEHLTFQQPVNNRNLQELASALIGQYRRTASLTTHDNVITSLGGDFRFEEAGEWDQQYENYDKLFSFINSHKSWYSTSVKFGNLAGYFEGLLEKNATLPIFKGDFLPYRNATFIINSDVIFPFSPAYWTGFYGTRPFWKKMSRETEDELFKAEIMFTFTYNLMRQRGLSSLSLYRNYNNLVEARQMVVLFQHHDGITGTSPRSTMLDYAKKLSKAWTFAQHIQKISIETLWRKELNVSMPPLESFKVRPDFNQVPLVIPTRLYATSYIVKKVILFNSLGWKRSSLVRLTVEDKDVIVRGPQGQHILAQINPNILGSQRKTYELLFVANLPPLSLATFEIYRQMGNRNASLPSSAAVRAKVTCKNCDGKGKLDTLKPHIALDNGRITAHFDGITGQLKGLRDRTISPKTMNLSVSFGKYESGIGSGAYLLRPYVSSVKSIPEVSDRKTSSLYLFEGPVMSEVAFISKKIRYSTWLVKDGDTELGSSLFMTNTLNASSEYGEFFMRVQSDISNNGNVWGDHVRSQNSQPVFFTDTNGHGVEKRVNIDKLPYQANTYPMTSYAFIQDSYKKVRLTLIADRTHGVSSPHEGKLELIIDRHMRFDDSRGMDEGIADSEINTNQYVLKLESFIPVKVSPNADDFKNWETSLEIQRAAKHLNHEPSIFLYDALINSKNGQASLLSGELPEDVHLLNLRTLTRSVGGSRNMPSSKALMILQQLGHRDTNNCEDLKSDKMKLNVSISLVNHYLQESNLVATKDFSFIHTQANSMGTKMFQRNQRLQMRNVPLIKRYDLSSYIVHF